MYGAYYRRLSKKVQTELAEANSVAVSAARHGAQCWPGTVEAGTRGIACELALLTPLPTLPWVQEEALSSMTTVKAHAAEDSTQFAYAVKLRRFYHLQRRCVLRLRVCCIVLHFGVALWVGEGVGQEIVLRAK